MFRPTSSVASALVLLSMLCGCIESRFGPFFGPDPDLILNGSFERHGQPTLDGWRVKAPHLTSVVREAPPGGGMWSLQLEADWAPTQGYVTRPIHGLRNGDVLRLSALVRALGDDGGGVVGLATGKSYELATHTKLASSAQKAWTPVSVEDTVSTAPGDTVWIVLSSFNTEITVRRGLFDRISLHRTRLVDRIGPALQVDGAQRARPATPAGTDGFPRPGARPRGRG